MRAANGLFFDWFTGPASHPDRSRHADADAPERTTPTQTPTPAPTPPLTPPPALQPLPPGYARTPPRILSARTTRDRKTKVEDVVLKLDQAIVARPRMTTSLFTLEKR